MSKRKYTTLLFDLDDTLLSFKKASIKAFDLTLKNQNIAYTKEMFKRYEEINLAHWKLLEQNKTTFDKLNIERFLDFNNEFKLNADTNKLSSDYVYYLAFQHQSMPYMKKVLTKLNNQGYKIYIVTNGDTIIQKRRYHESGLDKLTIKMFISQEIGYKKPDSRYFEYINTQIELDKKETLLIGDSLSSDIKGGINYGIDTCWITYKRNNNDKIIKPTYRISSLIELFDIL